MSAATTAVLLGQPLDFVVQLRPEPGEVFASACVSAEVQVSDRRLPSSQVRTVLEPQSSGAVQVRVQTTSAIDEPVVTISLKAGCSAPVTRRFVVFADPASSGHASPSGGAGPGAEAVAGAAAAASPTPSVVAAPAAAKRGDSVPAQGPVAAPRAPQLRADRQEPAATKAPRLTLVPVESQAAASPGGNAPETDLVAAALEAVAQAASAVRQASLNAAAAQAQVATLEKTVVQLRNENLAQQSTVAQLKSQLEQAQLRAAWTWPLMLAAMVLASLLTWLALRLAARSGAATQGQAHKSGVPKPMSDNLAAVDADPNGAAQRLRAPTGPVPFLGAEMPAHAARGGSGKKLLLPPSPEVKPGFAVKTATPPRLKPVGTNSVAEQGHPQAAAVAAARRVEATDVGMARTEPMPAPLRGDHSGVRDVSIEELIDLEQQAEFFIVLGQDDAAVDLLVDHLRSTGGDSPLPYLKLLEIYGRNGDRAAYERHRSRFNHRFNAYAPEWGSDLSHGRSLEDYPGILPRLAQVWQRPLDAMAELEALVFRKSRGELFDLPAYREVLFLYALARDLLDHEALSAGSVDLLLPLTDGPPTAVTAPRLLNAADRPVDRTRAANEDDDERPTRPGDFGLTIPMQTSIFEPADDAPRKPPLRQ